jgi:hypothetical protein
MCVGGVYIDVEVAGVISLVPKRMYRAVGAWVACTYVLCSWFVCNARDRLHEGGGD